MGHRRMNGRRLGALAIIALLASALVSTPGCFANETATLTAQSSTSCMKCHNASPENDYAGPGIENPHPFPGADNISCETCHGGNPGGSDVHNSHVPPPPQIGDDQNLINDREAYFNRLTLTGLDKYDDYTVNGQTYTAIDYIQFINPGDLRVVTQSRGCGQCHQGHAECVAGSLLATEAGVLSGALYAIGADNAVPANQGLHEDTAADLAFRAILDPDFPAGSPAVGQIGELIEHPLFSKRNANGPLDIHNNPLYDAPGLSDDRLADNRVITGSPLANLYHEQVAFTCGDCHLGSAGANNRSGDYRSSGCTSCHMQYSLGGRSYSSDPNVNKLEPVDPDDIDAPERAHPRSHRISSTYKTLPSGETIQGIDDYACAGCHQGSNRTVMQYWGIRLDQNEDLRRGRSVPGSCRTRLRQHDRTTSRLCSIRSSRNKHLQRPRSTTSTSCSRTTTATTRRHAGRRALRSRHGLHRLPRQLRPARWRHRTRPHPINVRSRMEPGRGDQAARAATAAPRTYAPTKRWAWPTTATTVPSSPSTPRATPLRHVVQGRSTATSTWLTSKLTGQAPLRGRRPTTSRWTRRTSATRSPSVPHLQPKASYAMGRADGNAATGIGPHQSAGVTPGFSPRTTWTARRATRLVDEHLHGVSPRG